MIYPVSALPHLTQQASIYIISASKRGTISGHIRCDGDCYAKMWKESFIKLLVWSIQVQTCGEDAKPQSVPEQRFPAIVLRTPPRPKVLRPNFRKKLRSQYKQHPPTTFLCSPYRGRQLCRPTLTPWPVLMRVLSRTLTIACQPQLDEHRSLNHLSSGTFGEQQTSDNHMRARSLGIYGTVRIKTASRGYETHATCRIVLPVCSQRLSCAKVMLCSRSYRVQTLPRSLQSVRHRETLCCSNCEERVHYRAVLRQRTVVRTRG